MILEAEMLMKILIPVGIVIGGVLLGLIVQKVVLSRLIKITARTKWAGDEIIIQSLKGVIILWFLIASAHIALPYIPLTPHTLMVLQKLLLALLIFSITLVIAKIASGFVQMYAARSKGAFPSTSIFVNVTKVIIIIIGFLVILQTLGISITPIITALGVGGLAVALALQDTLSNLFAGIHVIAAGKVRPGDYVKLDTGEEGYVTDITWRNTTIRALPNNTIVVPNAKLAGAILTNFSLPESEMSVLVQVGVSYDSDLKKVERVTIEVAREILKSVQGGVAAFEPFIRYHTFADFSINFTVILRAKEYVDQYLLKHEFVKRLHERYLQEGIEIPFPIRTVFMKKEGQ